MKQLPKILNKSEIARRIFPNNQNAPVLLNMKLSGVNRNRVTDEDREAIIKELEQAIAEIKNNA